MSVVNQHATAAIGTQPGKLMAIFLSEGLPAGLVGAVGIGLSYAVVAFLSINHWSSTSAASRSRCIRRCSDAMEVGGVLGLAVLVSALASLQPAWRAAWTIRDTSSFDAEQKMKITKLLYCSLPADTGLRTRRRGNPQEVDRNLEPESYESYHDQH